MAETPANETEEGQEPEPDHPTGEFDLTGMMIGAGIGVALGAAFGSVGVGIALGAGIGMMYTMMKSRRDQEQ